jgi:hypothetical protein
MDNDEFENIQPEKERVAIYSKWAILGFSIFCSTLVGSILLMLNLRRTGQKNAGYAVLLFGIVFMIIQGLIITRFAGAALTPAAVEKLNENNKVFYYITALNVLGGAILTEYFFRKYLTGHHYATRSAFPVLFIVLAIGFLLLYMM